MLIPYNVDVPMQRWPIANWVLIGATILIGYVFLYNPDPWLTTLVLWRGERFGAVQLVGNLFGHVGAVHLFGNMLFLFVFGNAVNAKLGHAAFLALYFGIGALVNLVWLALGEAPGTLGASGAIAGITGVFLVLYPRNDVSVLFWLYIRSWTFSLSSIWLILFYVAFDVWGLVGAGEAGVNFLAHLAGYCLGAGLAVAGLLSGMLRPARGEQTLVRLVRGAKETTPERSSPGIALRPPPMGRNRH
jgi:membrane associated rhomboid family serine protease